MKATIRIKNLRPGLLLAGCVSILCNAAMTRLAAQTPLQFAQQAYLKASNSGAQDRFGSSAAVSGDTAVVGAPFEDSNATGVNGNQNDNSAFASGAAYRRSCAWSPQETATSFNSPQPARQTRNGNSYTATP